MVTSYICPAREILLKFSSMRASFNENLKKVRTSKKSGAASEDVYTPTFKHYDALTFLLDQDEPREGVSSTAEPNSDVFKLNENNENISPKVASARKAQRSNRTTPGKFDELMEKAIKQLDESAKTVPDDITSRLIESYFLKLTKAELKAKFIQILEILD